MLCLWRLGRAANALPSSFVIRHQRSRWEGESGGYFRPDHKTAPSRARAQQTLSMATAQEHKLKALHNEAFLDLHKLSGGAFLDWGVTVLFYSALHWMRALAAQEGHQIKGYKGEEDVLTGTGVFTAEAYDWYRQLKDDSRRPIWDEAFFQLGLSRPATELLSTVQIIRYGDVASVTRPHGNKAWFEHASRGRWTGVAMRWWISSRRRSP